jgi:predicted ester cyclase
MLFKKLKAYVFGNLDKEVVSAKARNLLNDDAFRIAYESVQERVLSEIMTSDPKDADKRERLYQQYRAVEDVVFEINRLINNQSDQPRRSEFDQGE